MKEERLTIFKQNGTYDAKITEMIDAQLYPESAKWVHESKIHACLDKLGRIEDIEDALGIDLISFFNALMSNQSLKTSISIKMRMPYAKKEKDKKISKKEIDEQRLALEKATNKQ